MELRCEQLCIGYEHHVVQDSLDITANSGTMICLLGKNGCGKSTLLRSMAGLQPLLSGKILINLADDTYKNIDVSSLSATERARLISLVLTERLSIENTTIHDVVAMGRYPYSSFLGGLTNNDERVINQALEQTELNELSARFFNRLSDGEKQRVLIAKALAQQTPIILLDEPTAHLDLPNRIKVLSLLKNLAHSTQRIVIISTHELDLALQLADTIWLMMPNRQGLVIGSSKEMIATGAFQRAFNDDSFSLINNDGHLAIRI